jgi:iron(III) transport system substrate-binding protein
MRVLGRATAVAAALAAGVTLAACGAGSTSSGAGSSASAPADDKGTLTLYNAQHEDLMKLMVDGFTQQTGIKVTMRSGDDFELANQIVQEGDASPADVFVTENSPAMTLVDSKKLFAPVDAKALTQVPAQYVPSDKSWVGFAARSTVFAYNSKQLKQADLPASLLDLADPKWKGKIGMSPGGADFQAIVSAVLELKGEAATAQWLKGLKENAKIYQGNTTVMKAVNAGEIAGGIIYHYYWYKDRAESGANSKDVELHFFGKQDPGAFVSVSGAGVLQSSKHAAQAQQLVEYLTSQAGQKVLADSPAMEYTVGKDSPANAKLKPLASLQAPAVDAAQLNGPKVVELMQEASLL